MNKNASAITAVSSSERNHVVFESSVQRTLRLKIAANKTQQIQVKPFELKASEVNIDLHSSKNSAEIGSDASESMHVLVIPSSAKNSRQMPFTSYESSMVSNLHY